MRMKKHLAVLIVLLLLGPFRLSAQNGTNQDKTGQDRIVTKSYVRLVSPNPKVHDSSGAPADFVKVDKEPTIVFQAIPIYPEAALKDSLEGRVFVKIWVDTNGNSRKVVVLKSDNDVFNQPSVDAAMKYKFTPAMVNGKPVDVWVVIPFSYKMKTGK